ncbi:hypothetical protein FRB95_009670 [Tulasnella sp. JGI-2019a]|nr:hypothetical protein FRB95_009670 [Tulasnella sp. JGI-2019a]
MSASAKRTRAYDEEVDGLVFGQAPKKLQEEAPKVDPTPVEAKAMKEDEERKESRRKELLTLAGKMNKQQNWLVLNNSEGAIGIVL